MLVSIVMPVYNQERYLRQALPMVLGQTYEDIEVVAVNDGSTDESPDILDEFASWDKRLKVVSQENKGLLGANVTGIENASGQYLCFFDPDDAIGSGFVGSFVSQLDRPYDFVARGITYRFSYGDIPFPLSSDATLSKGDIRRLAETFVLDRSLAMDNQVFVARWNKLYRRDCLLDFVDEYASCAPVSLGEDSLFTYLLLQRANLGKTVREPSSYCYVQHDDSMTHLVDYEKLLGGYGKTFETFLKVIANHAGGDLPAYLLYYGQVSGLLSRAIDEGAGGTALYRRLQHSARYREALRRAFDYSEGSNLNAKLQYRRCPAALYAAVRKAYKATKRS